MGRKNSRAARVNMRKYRLKFKRIEYNKKHLTRDGGGGGDEERKKISIPLRKMVHKGKFYDSKPEPKTEPLTELYPRIKTPPRQNAATTCKSCKKKSDQMLKCCDCSNSFCNDCLVVKTEYMDRSCIQCNVNRTYFPRPYYPTSPEYSYLPCDSPQRLTSPQCSITPIKNYSQCEETTAYFSDPEISETEMSFRLPLNYFYDLPSKNTTKEEDAKKWVSSAMIQMEAKFDELFPTFDMINFIVL